MTGPPSRVIDVLAPLERPGTRLLYEAGPTGYALARAGTEAGIEVTVCAPGSVPRGPGERIKTDVATPSGCCGWRALVSSRWSGSRRAEEAFRDLIRAREDAAVI